MNLKKFVSVFSCLAATSIVAGCGPFVYLPGEQKIQYVDLCDGTSPRCGGTGHPTISMPRYRPLYEGDPKKYLGTLVLVSDVEQPRQTCYAIKEEDIIQPFSHTIQITTIRDTQIKAAIDAATKATLGPGVVDDAPSLAATLTASVSSSLRKQNYAAAEYTLYTLKNDVLVRLQSAPAGTPEALCRDAVMKSPGRAFVRSFSIIKAETRMSSDAKNAITSAVELSVSGFKYNNGAFSASLSASLSASIASSVEQTITAQTPSFQTVYSYALWTEIVDSAAKASILSGLDANEATKDAAVEK